MAAGALLITKINTTPPLAAAILPPNDATLLVNDFGSNMELSVCDCQVHYILSHRELINCGLQSSTVVTEDNIPVDTVRPEGYRKLSQVVDAAKDEG